MWIFFQVVSVVYPANHIRTPPKFKQTLLLTVTKWVSHSVLSIPLLVWSDLLPSASHPWRRQQPVRQSVIQFGIYRTMSNTDKCCSLPFTNLQQQDNKGITQGMASFFTFVEKCNVIRVLSVRTLSECFKNSAGDAKNINRLFGLDRGDLPAIVTIPSFCCWLITGCPFDQ